MTKRPWRLRAAVAVVVGCAALVAAGCGGDSATADLAAGKTLFTSSGCAGCHALADAGSGPGIGPDLDDSWRASRQAGMEDSQFAGTIERWIRIAQLPMPRNSVTGQDAIDVAAYVASVAGTTPESAVFPAGTTPEVPDPPRQDQY